VFVFIDRYLKKLSTTLDEVFCSGDMWTVAKTDWILVEITMQIQYNSDKTLQCGV